MTPSFSTRRALTAIVGLAMLDRIAEKVADVASVEQQARMEGRSMSIMLIGK